mmetsp:Transcript_34872/g.71163  ORF Transcript_34872/g.71163 Transcript_34872/m.71163 type:complete len:217 (-) Transcript_34872:660-1310(-)
MHLPLPRMNGVGAGAEVANQRTNQPTHLRNALRATHGEAARGAIMVLQIGYGTAGGGTKQSATMHGPVMGGMGGMGTGMVSKHRLQQARQQASLQKCRQENPRPPNLHQACHRHLHQALQCRQSSHQACHLQLHQACHRQLHQALQCRQSSHQAYPRPRNLHHACHQQPHQARQCRPSSLQACHRKLHQACHRYLHRARQCRPTPHRLNPHSGDFP